MSLTKEEILSKLNVLKSNEVINNKTFSANVLFVNKKLTKHFPTNMKVVNPDCLVYFWEGENDINGSIYIDSYNNYNAIISGPNLDVSGSGIIGSMKKL